MNLTYGHLSLIIFICIPFIIWSYFSIPAIVKILTKKEPFHSIPVYATIYLAMTFSLIVALFLLYVVDPFIELMLRYWDVPIT